MRFWQLRTTTRRAHAQRAILPIVALVALACTTLLAGLSLLVSSTERFALTSTLTTASPSETSLDLELGAPRSPSTTDIVTGVDAAASRVFGSVPTTSALSVSSTLQRVPETSDGQVLTYFASYAAFADHSRLTSGTWPGAPTETTDTDTGQVRVIPVAIPTAAARSLGWKVGDRIFVTALRDFNAAAVFEVTGTYASTDAGADYWAQDRLAGAAFDPSFPIPGTGGRATGPAYGPLVVDPAAFHSAKPGATPQAETVHLSYTPDLSGVRANDIGPLLDRLAGAEDTTIQKLTSAVDTVDVRSNLPDLLRRVLGSLTITRSSVLVAGLMLLVLGVAALLQTARLLADRRLGEQHLMRARGASSGQLITLAALEAVALAVVTTVSAPPLARLLFRFIAHRSVLADAGMDQDPGIPAMTWYVAGAVGIIFAIVLISPLLKRATTFVESEQARARPDRASVLQRSGLDLGIAVLAGLAYWQLRSYQSPVLGGGTSYRIDPVLTVGPALALLAGALLCVRLVPAASRLTERIAARGRGVVSPLAAWEVGRRPTRATSAILLLTLALAVGTFAQSFLATWNTSQTEQAQFLHPAAALVTSMPTDPFTQRATLAAADPAAEPSPVLDRRGVLGTLEEGRFGQDIAGGQYAQVVGLSQGAAAQLTGDRAAVEGVPQITEFFAKSAPAATTGIALPGAPTAVRAHAWVTPSEPAPAGTALVLSLLVQNEDGLVRVVNLGAIPLDGEKHDVEGSLLQPRVAGGTPLIGVAGLRVIGFQAMLSVSPMATQAFPSGLTMAIGINDLRSAEPSDVRRDSSGAIAYTETPVQAGTDTSWYSLSSGLAPLTTTGPPEAQLGLSRVRVTTEMLRFGQARLASVSEPLGTVRALVTPGLLRDVGGSVGEPLALMLDETIVEVTVVGTIDHVPGSDPYGDAVVVDLAELNQAVARGLNPPILVDEWWVDLPAARSDAFAQTIEEQNLGTASTRTALVRERTTDPLRVGTQGALWLVSLAAVILAAAGFAIHAAVTIRTRETEFAQLRAVGLSRNSLTRVVAIESLLLSILGGVFGIGLGIGLSWLVGPLVGFTVDGRAPFPPVLVHIPWPQIGLLAGEVVALLAVVVLAVAHSMRTADPATVLRFGDER